ncbi:hypothetical protein [Parafrankia elaeagni]|uniref:hypothetical protein n=1 Tax=Parafrankia elaeagni TaxID=222534 RepID=UPI00036575D1
MTVCGLLRLDGADVRRSELTGMLAASSIGLPAARQVHLDGSFGVVAAANDATEPMPPVLVEPSGLVIVIADHGPGGRVVPVRRARDGHAGTRTGPSLHVGRLDRPDRPRGAGQPAGVVRVTGPIEAVGSARRSEAGRAGAGSVTVLRPVQPRRPVPSSRQGNDIRLGNDIRPGHPHDMADDAGHVRDTDTDTDPGQLGAIEDAWRTENGAGDRNARAAAALLRAYRAAGHRALGTLGEHLLAIVWEPARRRLIVSRGGRRADDLVIWSDGRYFAFGVEQAQVLAAGPLGTGRPRRLAAGETLPVTVATRLRRPPAAEFSGPRS